VRRGTEERKRRKHPVKNMWTHVQGATKKEMKKAGSKTNGKTHPGRTNIPTKKGDSMPDGGGEGGGGKQQYARLIETKNTHCFLTQRKGGGKNSA